MLNRFEVSVAREEVDGVDTLRYSFEKLLAQAVSLLFQTRLFIILMFSCFVREQAAQSLDNICSDAHRDKYKITWSRFNPSSKLIYWIE